MTDTTENTTAKPAASESPGDLFSLLSSFASRMAILSSISEKEKFWEDPTALKVGLSTYANARYLRNTLTTQLELADGANQMLRDQIQSLQKAADTLDKEIEIDTRKLKGVTSMIAKDEAGTPDGEEPEKPSSLRPRREILEKELAEKREDVVTKRRILLENEQKFQRISEEVKKARVLNDRFLGLFEECFEKWEVFDEATLKDLAINGPTEEIREMVRAAVEDEPDKVVTISRTDWGAFRRSLDMFVVDSMLEAETEVVVLTDGTLRNVRNRTEEVQARVMQHIDAKLTGGAWMEIGKLAEEWRMAPEVAAYAEVSERAKMYIDAGTLARAGEFISESMQQQVLIGIIEWLQGGVFQGYTSFGKDAGFNTLMITVDGFYLLYQWRAVPFEYRDSSGVAVYTTVNAIHVFEIDLIFCDAQGTEIEHELHDDAKKKLKEQKVDLRRHYTTDGEKEEEEAPPAKSAILDGLRGS
jgi:hypothetical protein